MFFYFPIAGMTKAAPDPFVLRLGRREQAKKFPLRKLFSVRGFHIFYFSSSFFIISGPCSTKIPAAAAFFSVKEEMPFFFTLLS